MTTKFSTPTQARTTGVSNLRNRKRHPGRFQFPAPVDDNSSGRSIMNNVKTIKTGWVWLAALVVAASWASLETVRLAKATDQIEASQNQQLRTAARAEASRAKTVQMAHSEAAPSTSQADEKR